MKANIVIPDSPRAMRPLALAAFVALLWTFAAPIAPAQATSHTSGAPAQATEMASGEVRRIDREQNKITLRHGEIRNLEMPPMSMVFGVSDPALLDKVAVGDKVRFRAEKVDGQFVVTAIEK